MNDSNTSKRTFKKLIEVYIQGMLVTELINLAFSRLPFKNTILKQEVRGRMIRLLSFDTTWTP
jgi:hypothetical protein